MAGISRNTGRALDGDAHLIQSITDILTTPIGTRVLRRDYGSDLPRVIDRPLNGETLIDVYVAVAEALARWEPRIYLTRVRLGDADASGSATIELTVEIPGEGQVLEIDTGASIEVAA